MKSIVREPKRLHWRSEALWHDFLSCRSENLAGNEIEQFPCLSVILPFFPETDLKAPPGYELEKASLVRQGRRENNGKVGEGSKLIQP